MAEHEERMRLRHPASHNMPPTMIPRPAGAISDWERGALMEPEAGDAAEERAVENCIEVDTGTSRNAIPERTASRSLPYVLLIITFYAVFYIENFEKPLVD